MSNLNFTADLRKIYYHQFSTALFTLNLNVSGLTAIFSNNNSVVSRTRSGEGWGASGVSIQYLNPNNVPKTTYKLNYHGSFRTAQTGNISFIADIIIRRNGANVQTIRNDIFLEDNTTINGTFFIENMNHNDLYDFVINYNGGVPLDLNFHNFQVSIEEL